MALNKVMLIGNVGQDPDIRILDNGNKVASFSLATSERYKDRNGDAKEVTTWHRLIAWRTAADIVEKYVHKGDQIYIEGKLTSRQWQDQQGNTHTATEIQVANIQLLGKLRNDDRTQESSPAPAAPVQRQESESLNPADNPEDLPF